MLERFHMDLPMLFEDARATLDEIEIDGPLAISPQTTIMETLELMSEQNKPVSYTHLDVYKRQEYAFPLYRRAVERY